MLKKEKKEFALSLEELLFKRGRNPNGTVVENKAPPTKAKRDSLEEPKKLNVPNDFAAKLALDFGKRKLGAESLNKERAAAHPLPKKNAPTAKEVALSGLAQTEELPARVSQTAWDLFKSQYGEGSKGQTTGRKKTTQQPKSVKKTNTIPRETKTLQEVQIPETKAETYFVQAGSVQPKSAKVKSVKQAIPVTKPEVKDVKIQKNPADDEDEDEEPRVLKKPVVRKKSKKWPAVKTPYVKTQERNTPVMIGGKETLIEVEKAQQPEAEPLKTPTPLKTPEKKALIIKAPQTIAPIEKTAPIVKASEAVVEERKFQPAIQSLKESQEGVVAVKNAEVSVDKIDKLLFVEINKVRNNPLCYIPLLEAELKKGKYQREAVEEAIMALEKKEPVMLLAWRKELEEAAQAHVGMAGVDGSYGHIGTDDSTPVDRVRRFYGDVGAMTALLHFGPLLDPEDIVLGLIIDENDTERRNRDAVFSFWEFFGCNSGTHKTAKYMTTLNFAQSRESTKQLLEIAVAAWEERIEEPEAHSALNGGGWVKKEQAVTQSNGIITITNTYIYKDEEPSIIRATIHHYSN